MRREERTPRTRLFMDLYYSYQLMLVDINFLCVIDLLWVVFVCCIFYGLILVPWVGRVGPVCCHRIRAGLLHGPVAHAAHRNRWQIPANTYTIFVTSPWQYSVFHRNSSGNSWKPHFLPYFPDNIHFVTLLPKHNISHAPKKYKKRESGNH